jgi:hypothetical protein
MPFVEEAVAEQERKRTAILLINLKSSQSLNFKYDPLASLNKFLKFLYIYIYMDFNIRYFLCLINFASFYHCLNCLCICFNNCMGNF